VVDKLSGVAVLPERWEPKVANLLEEAERRWPGVTAVHRIDKETSGLLLLAKTAEAARNLQVAFEQRRIGKVYHALVKGRPSWDNLDCEAPLLIDADRHHRTVVARDTDPEAKRATSRFSVLERFRTCSLVAIELMTGRTHQIRAHAAHLGHPLIGDPLYGGPKSLLLSGFKSGWRGDPHEERPLIDRVALHAWRLHFEHPLEPRMLDFCAEYPKDIRASLAQLRRWS
jgi:RluA family pseudouridine synthase